MCSDKQMPFHVQVAANHAPLSLTYSEKYSRMDCSKDPLRFPRKRTWDHVDQVMANALTFYFC